MAAKNKEITEEELVQQIAVYKKIMEPLNKLTKAKKKCEADFKAYLKENGINNYNCNGVFIQLIKTDGKDIAKDEEQAMTFVLDRKISSTCLKREYRVDIESLHQQIGLTITQEEYNLLTKNTSRTNLKVAME